MYTFFCSFYLKVRLMFWFGLSETYLFSRFERRCKSVGIPFVSIVKLQFFFFCTIASRSHFPPTWPWSCIFPWSIWCISLFYAWLLHLSLSLSFYIHISFFTLPIFDILLSFIICIIRFYGITLGFVKSDSCSLFIFPLRKHVQVNSWYIFVVYSMR